MEMTPRNIPVNLDEVLKKFKLSGRYHRESYILMIIALLISNMYAVNYVFVAEKTDYRCRDDAFANNTCSHADNATQVCSEWVYDNPHSFVAEFQLACQEWKRTLIGTMHSFGYMVGLLFVGPLSDRIGRKPMAVMLGVTGGIMGIARSFTRNYWLYIILEFLEGAVGDMYSPIYIIGIEIVDSERRILYQMLTFSGAVIGPVVLPLVVYLVPYWRSLLQVLYTPALLFFFYIFLLDESPRWLLSKGKKGKAVAILEKAAKKNKIKLDQNALDKLVEKKVEKSVGYIYLLKETFASVTLVKRFFICLTWWTVSSFVNYGMTINTTASLNGNKYLNFAFVEVMDIPANLVLIYILNKFRRKMPLIVSFMTTAVLCLAQPFVPKSLPWLSIILYMAGKFMSSAYFNITYIFTSELFPTYTRNSMHALCSSLGRVGSIIAPQTPLLMQYWSGLPALIFSIASLFGGLVTLFVPDTSDEALPDTVRQAEAVGAKNKEADDCNANELVTKQLASCSVAL